MFFERLIRFFLHHPVAANLLMGLLLLLGLRSLLTIPQEIFPEFRPPEIHIEAELPGANVERVEKTILLPIERALKGEKGIQQVVANATAGKAEIRLELSRDYSREELLGTVKSRVEGIDSLPNALEGLVITPRDDRTQLLWLHLTGGQLHEMLPTADRLQRQLHLQSFVSRVEMVGVGEQELEIIADPDQLYALGLTLGDLKLQLAANNLDLDAGFMRSNERIGIAVRNESAEISRLQTLPISLQNSSQTIPLGEIAEVQYRTKEPGSLSRLNGDPAIGFAVYRHTGADPLATVAQLSNFLEIFNSGLPPGWKTVLWLDESRELASRLSLLTKNGLFGLLLVLGILLFFTHWRIAVWVAAGIPVVYLAAFWAMNIPGIGLTLNVITLFGFLIVSGILVDDALVVSESIYSQYQAASSKQVLGTDDHAQRITQATLAGIRQVAAPAVFGVLTTIAAFMPLTMLEGDLGHAIGAVALVIILCLLFSIVESKLILPAHLHHGFLRHGKLPAEHNRLASRLLESLRRRYQRLLRWSLDRPGLIINIALGCLIITFAAVSSGWVRTTMIPNIADFELEAEIVAPVNAVLADQDRVTAMVEGGLFKANQELQNKYRLDYPPMANLYAVRDTDNRISLNAELTPVNENPVSLTKFVAAWRSHIPSLPTGYSLSLSATAEPEDGINVQLEGVELKTLVDAAEELKDILGSYPGVMDIRDNYGAKQQEYRLVLTEEAKAMGISLDELSQALRAAVYGLEVQRLQLPDREVQINLRYPEGHRDQLTDIANLQIRHSGQWFLLNQLADFAPDASLTSITRVNGQRAVNVFASNDDSLATADQIMDSLEDGYLESLVARYPGLTYRVEGEARESEEVQASLVIAALLAFFSVFALLALPLGSFKTPLLVMAVVPFSLIGVVLAHVLMHIPLNIMSFFGAIALVGVLVNDSLVLLYQYKVNLSAKNSGKAIREVLIDTCRQRFRPILITSVTTFLGVMPIIFETDPEAQWLIPIALSLGVGILFGTLITLVILPALVILTSAKLGRLPLQVRLSEDLRSPFLTGR